MRYAYHNFQLPYAIYLVARWLIGGEICVNLVEMLTRPIHWPLFVLGTQKRPMFWSNSHEESTAVNFRLEYNQVDAVTK